MKQPIPGLEELRQDPQFQQRVARIKARLEILDWIKNEEKCLLLMQRATAALKGGDRRGWRRRMLRICDLSGIDPTEYGLDSPKPRSARTRGD